MNKFAKPRWRTILSAAEIAFCVLIIFWLLWPRTFQHMMPGLELSEVTGCEVLCFISNTENGVPTSTIQTRSFAPDSKDFAQLVELLNSSRYRLQLSNIFVGGALGQYSVTLSPYAEITFTQGNQQYEFDLLGKDIPAGRTSEKRDYSAWKGLPFQKEVVAFVSEHGTLTDEYTS